MNIAYALTFIYSDDQTSQGSRAGCSSSDAPSIAGAVTYSTVLTSSSRRRLVALTQTARGRHVYAVGDNPEAARLSGIKTRRVLLSVYLSRA